MDGVDREPLDDSSAPTSWRSASTDPERLKLRAELPPIVTHLKSMPAELRARVDELDTPQAMALGRQLVHAAREAKRLKPAMNSPSLRAYVLDYIAGHMNLRDHLVSQYCHDGQELDKLIAQQQRERPQEQAFSALSGERKNEKRSALAARGCVLDDDGIAAQLFRIDSGSAAKTHVLERRVSVQFVAGTANTDKDGRAIGTMKHDPKHASGHDDRHVRHHIIVEFKDGSISATPGERPDHINLLVFVPFNFLNDDDEPLVKDEEQCQPNVFLILDIEEKLEFLGSVLGKMNALKTSDALDGVINILGGWKLKKKTPANLKQRDGSRRARLELEVPLDVWNDATIGRMNDQLGVRERTKVSLPTLARYVEILQDELLQSNAARE